MKMTLILLSIPLLLTGCGDSGNKGGCPACPECEKIPVPETINYEVISYLPFYTDLLDKCKDDDKIPFPSGITHESDIPIQGGKNLANSLNNVSFKEENILKDVKINKETIKLLGKNQVVLIQSHGDYIDEYSHETIVTGEHYIESEISKEDEDRIVQSSISDLKTEYWYSAITPEYIKAYCPDVTGSIIYMGQCHGGHDWGLAQAFIDKGAVAVYGASLQIQMHYGDMMQYRVTSLLGEINPTTNNYYTTGEALKKAQNEYGIDDSVLYGGGGAGARMILYGDPNFRLANK